MLILEDEEGVSKASFSFSCSFTKDISLRVEAEFVHATARLNKRTVVLSVSDGLCLSVNSHIWID